jgi:hypothetical protein
MSFIVGALPDDVGALSGGATLTSTHEVIPAILFSWRKDLFMSDCEA